MWCSDNIHGSGVELLGGLRKAGWPGSNRVAVLCLCLKLSLSKVLINKDEEDKHKWPDLRNSVRISHKTHCSPAPASGAWQAFDNHVHPDGVCACLRATQTHAREHMHTYTHTQRVMAEFRAGAGRFGALDDSTSRVGTTTTTNSIPGRLIWDCKRVYTYSPSHQCLMSD